MKQGSDGAPASARPFQPTYLKDKKQTSKSLRVSQSQRSSEMLEFEEMMSKLTQEGSSAGKAARSACSSSAMGEGSGEVNSKNPKVEERNYSEGRNVVGHIEVQEGSQDLGNLAKDKLMEVDGSNAGNPQKKSQKIIFSSEQLRLLCNELIVQKKLSIRLPDELDPNYDPSKWKQPQPPFNYQQRPWWPNNSENHSDNQDSRGNNYNDSVQRSQSEGGDGGNFSPHSGGPPAGSQQFAQFKSEGDWGASFVTNKNSQNQQKMPQNQFPDGGWGRQAGPNSNFNSNRQNQRGINDFNAQKQNNPEFGFRGQSQIGPNSNTRNNSNSFGDTGWGSDYIWNQNQQSGNIKNPQNSNQKDFENTNNCTGSEPQVDGSWGADLIPVIQRGQNNRKQPQVRAGAKKQWKDDDSWQEEGDSDQDEKQVQKNQQLQNQQDKVNDSFQQVQKVQSRVRDGSESGGWSSSDDEYDKNDEKVQSRDHVKNDDGVKVHVKPNLNSNLNPNQLSNNSNPDSHYDTNLTQRDNGNESQNIQATNLNSKFDKAGNNDLRNMVDNCRKVVKEQGFTDNTSSSNNQEDPWSTKFQDVPGVKPKPFIPNSSFEPERKNKIMLEEFKSKKNENQNQNRNPTNVSQFDNENYDCQNKNMFLGNNPSQPDQRFVAPVKQQKQQICSDKNRGSSKSLFNIPEEDEDNNSEVNRGPKEVQNIPNPQFQKSSFCNNQNTQKFAPCRQVDENQRVFRLLVNGLDSESELDCEKNDLFPFDALDSDKKVVEKVLENLKNKSAKPVSTKTTQLNSTTTALAANQSTIYTNYSLVTKENQILQQLEQKSRQQTQQQSWGGGSFPQQPPQNSENLTNRQDTRNFQKQDIVDVDQQQNFGKTVEQQTELDQHGGRGSWGTQQEIQGNFKQEFQKKDEQVYEQEQQGVHKKEEDENIRAANCLPTEDQVSNEGVSKFVSGGDVAGSGAVGQGRAAVVENDQSLHEVETKSSLETTGGTISGSSQEVLLATLKHQHGIQVTELKEQLAGLQKQWEVQKQGLQRQLEVQQKQLDLQRQSFEEHTALLQQQLNNMAEKVKTLEQVLNQ